MIAVPEGLKLRSLLEENRELKKATVEYEARIESDKYIIDSSEASIKILKREKQDILNALNKKEVELVRANNQLYKLYHKCSDNSEDKGTQIETAILGKRKRLGE